MSDGRPSGDHDACGTQFTPERGLVRIAASVYDGSLHRNGVEIMAIEFDPHDRRTYPWIGLNDLCAPSRVRIVRWEAPVPPIPYTDRMNFEMFGKEGHFLDEQAIIAVLDRLEIDLMLDRASWRSQRPFYLRFFRSFFADVDHPAWITAISTRRGFADRMTDRRARGATARVQLGRPAKIAVASPAYLHTLDSRLRLDRLLLRHHAGAPSEDVRFVEMHLYRRLQGDGLGDDLAAHEVWCCLAERGTEDRALVRAGNNPNTAAFQDAKYGLQLSPVINLIRLNRRGTGFVHRCVRLWPRLGDCIGIGEFEYHSAAYRFRSDPITIWAHHQLLDASSSDRF